MSLLTMCQNVAAELGLPRITSVVNSTDATVRQLKALVERAGYEAQKTYPFAELVRDFTITTVAGTQSYALPGDFDRFITSTHWDATNDWEIIGATSAQEWSFRINAITATGPRKRWRVSGSANAQFLLHPTPDSADTIVFQYRSKNWLRPILWTASTTFAAGSYCFVSGRFYYTTNGGTSGSTSLSHVTGSASDGGISWAYYGDTYQTALTDNDTALIDEKALEMDVLWRFRRAKGLEYESYRRDAEDALKRASVAKRGLKDLNLAGTPVNQLIGMDNVPDADFG